MVQCSLVVSRWATLDSVTSFVASLETDSDVLKIDLELIVGD